MAKSISKKNSWLSVVNSMDPKEPVELRISGTIGASAWDETGISAKEFNASLDEIPNEKNIVVSVNSEGGSVADGLAIYNSLRRRGDEKVSCRVDGYAVSIASVIALAGGKRISPKSSIWMIHEPWAMAAGNAEDMRKMASALEVHAESIVSIYAERTGLNANTAREKMRAETWFRGEEAKTMGFATDVSEEAVALNSIDFTKFRNAPKDILQTLVAQSKADTHQATASAECIPITFSATSLSATEEVGNSEQKQTADPAEQKDTTMPESAPVAAAAPPAQDNTAIILDKIASLEQKFAALQSPPLTQPIPNESRVTLLNEGEFDRISKLKTAKERCAAYAADWPGLVNDAMARDRRGEKIKVFERYPVENLGPIQNANTLSATITTSFLLDGAITQLQNRWAPLMAFTRDFSADEYKPLGTAVLKYVSATTAASSTATDFEVGGDTIDPISVTMAHWFKSFSVTQVQLNSGLRMLDLIDINSAGIADAIIKAATAPLTVANYETTGGQTSLTCAAAAFSFSDLATVRGQLKKSPIKNVLLDGEYLSKIINTPTFYQIAGVQPGGGWRAFGWDYIAENTVWSSSAATGISGFACNPQAVVCVAGLPVEPPAGVPGNTLQRTTATVPDVGITIANYSWFSLQSRTAWNSFDLMFGAAAGDKTAGVIIKSQ